jgi:hypothetical protein
LNITVYRYRRLRHFSAQPTWKGEYLYRTVAHSAGRQKVYKADGCVKESWLCCAGFVKMQQFVKVF